MSSSCAHQANLQLTCVCSQGLLDQALLTTAAQRDDLTREREVIAELHAAKVGQTETALAKEVGLKMQLDAEVLRANAALQTSQKAEQVYCRVPSALCWAE